METLEAISKRASLKTYLSAREVEQEKIIKVLDAARLAPYVVSESGTIRPLELMDTQRELPCSLAALL